MVEVAVKLMLENQVEALLSGEYLRKKIWAYLLQAKCDCAGSFRL